MSLLVQMPLEPPVFPKAGSILLRGLLGEIQVKIRVLGEARLLGPMPHRGAHFGSQAVLQGVSMHSLRQKQVPRSDLPTGGRISFFLKAWEKLLRMFGHFLSSEVGIAFNFVSCQDCFFLHQSGALACQKILSR